MMEKARPLAIFAAVALLAVGGCSGDEKSYSVPEVLCGVPVRRDMLKDLLPDGARLKIEESHTYDVPEYRFCDVVIDGKVELSSEGVWRKAGFTAEDTAKAALVFNTEPRQGGKFQVWKSGATTAFECRNARQKAGAFSLEVRVVRPEGNMADKVERYLASYAEEYRKILPCES
ncbi:hypothetical protein [Streptomyces sp. NPDC056061]|uniref:hypothetical protein n=1 Tax=Streptomyces sp. NPDC056061 TaxID=3345700 RepID=UPI0035DB29E9